MLTRTTGNHPPPVAGTVIVRTVAGTDRIDLVQEVDTGRSTPRLVEAFAHCMQQVNGAAEVGSLTFAA